MLAYTHASECVYGGIVTAIRRERSFQTFRGRSPVEADADQSPKVGKKTGDSTPSPPPVWLQKKTRIGIGGQNVFSGHL